MEQYIDKSALVAEIENKIREYRNEYNCYKQYVVWGKIEGLKEILSFLDTLEVKEVDLEKEIKCFTMSKELYEADNVIKAVAEHFFELGLKVAQEGK